ncbi:hypothetical protein D918_08398 [Trichuris suis]|nr:hypothetical protein D918_08398 [Trichuris suis]
MEEPTGNRLFLDLGLIPEFDGSARQSVAEWYQKLELMPEGDKKSAANVREALMSEFAMDLSAAYDEFTTRQLRNGEAPDVFLAELRTLASLFGGISEKGLACAFLAGLPERVRHLLKAGLRMEDLSVSQEARAWGPSRADQARMVHRADASSAVDSTILPGIAGVGGGTPSPARMAATRVPEHDPGTACAKARAP